MTSPIVVSLEKLLLDSVSFDKLKAGIEASDAVKKILVESIDVAGLLKGVVEVVLIPELQTVLAGNAIAAEIIPLIVVAGKPAFEAAIDKEVAALHVSAGLV